MVKIFLMLLAGAVSPSRLLVMWWLPLLLLHRSFVIVQAATTASSLPMAREIAYAFVENKEELLATTLEAITDPNLLGLGVIDLLFARGHYDMVKGLLKKGVKLSECFLLDDILPTKDTELIVWALNNGRKLPSRPLGHMKVLIERQSVPLIKAVVDSGYHVWEDPCLSLLGLLKSTTTDLGIVEMILSAPFDYNPEARLRQFQWSDSNMHQICAWTRHPVGRNESG